MSSISPLGDLLPDLLHAKPAPAQAPAGPPAPSVRLDSPLIPQAVVERRQALRARIATTMGPAKTSGDRADTVPVVDVPVRELWACTGGISGGLSLVGVFDGTLATVGGTTAAISGVLFVLMSLIGMSASSVRAAQRDLAKIRDDYTFLAPQEGPGRALMEDLFADFRALPTHLQAECMSMLDAVRVAGESLVVAPADKRFLRVLRDRARLVKQVRAEWEALQADLRAAHASLELGSSWSDDTDMDAAQQIRQALAAVRADHGLD